MKPKKLSAWLGRLSRKLRTLWWLVRETSGDAAYEKYLAARLRTESTPPGNLLSAEEFYLDVLRRRYTGVSRCC